MKRGERPSLAMEALRLSIVLIPGLAVADVIGVIACVVADVTPLRFGSSLLAYAIWLVVGVFAGLFILGFAGSWISGTDGMEWTDRPGSRRLADRLIGISLAWLLALSFLFHRLWWGRGVAGEYFVPDSLSHTILFFLSVLAGMAVVRLITAEGKA